MTERQAAIEAVSGAGRAGADSAEPMTWALERGRRLQAEALRFVGLGRARAQRLHQLVMQVVVSACVDIERGARRLSCELPSPRVAVALLAAVFAMVTGMIVLLEQIMPPWRAALWTSAVMAVAGIALLQMTIDLARARDRVRVSYARAVAAMREVRRARGPLGAGRRPL